MADSQAPQQALAPEVASLAEGISHVQEVPPQREEGGEFQLLIAKLRAWWTSGELQALVQQSRLPLIALVGLVIVLVVLQITSALLASLGGVPMLPGLLELVGLIWLVRYGLPRLLRSDDRSRWLADLGQRWRAFRGAS